MATPTTVEINGYALRELRVRSNIGVQELADQIDRDRSYVAKIELGHNERVSPETFGAILKTLGVKDRRALLADPHGNYGVKAQPAGSAVAS